MPILQQVSRLYHTVKHLKAQQIVCRIWRRLHHPAIDQSLSLSRRSIQGVWIAPIGKPDHLVSSRRFRFLNVSRDCSFPADWNNEAIEKLWLYNLHYFDDLQSWNADSRSALHFELVGQWITDNPPGVGNGWEPYPSSLRLVNWIKWTLAGNECSGQMLHSLGLQAQFLRKQLEHHLLGNHLFANGKALIYAGLFFDGDVANEWLAQGLRIIEQQVAEQVLDDGGHFERSPMYHAIILEDLLDLINVMTAYGMPAPDGWRDKASQMFFWLSVMTHPDGEVAFFNDSVGGIASSLKDLELYAVRLGLGSIGFLKAGTLHLAASGYVRVVGRRLAALLDVGLVGPDYLPGHAHADTLSFEMSLWGQRVVVNSGISQYGLGAERTRQRGTAAHSTVELDGKDSSEVWGGFRVARRARPFDLMVTETEKGVEVYCAHDGYRRLPGKPVHRRRWLFIDGCLEVNDCVEGGQCTAVARYHLHPLVKAQGDGQEGVLLLPGGQTVRWRAVNSKVRIAASTYHPEFGLSMPNSCLELTCLEGKASLIFSWD